MMKKGRKVISMLTVVLLVVLSFAPCAMAVTYPEGVTKEQISSTIGKTDILIETLVGTTKEGSLKNMILPELYTDEVLSSLAVGIYSAVEENAESISSIGLDVSTKGVASHLGAYPEVQEKLSSFDKWSESDLSGTSWNVKDKESFIGAAASVMAPFNDLLYALLCGGRYSINAIIGFEGAKGYETAIVPTLRSLGCESITDSAEFYAQAKENKNSMLENIIGDVFKLVERILDAPCDVLTDILPGIAYFLEEGGLDNAVATLIEPLKLQLFSISTFIKVENILSFIQDSESFTQDFTLNFNDILGQTGLEIAEINLQELVSCGVVSDNGTVVSDKAATFTVLMRWLIDTAKINKDSLKDFLGEDTAEMAKIIDNLMAKDTDDIIGFVVRLLNDDKGEFNDYKWSFTAFESANVSYTTNLSKEKFQRVVDGIDELLDQFIAEGGEYKTVKKALAPEIYSNKLLSTLVCEIYGMLSGEELQAIGAVAGLDITPAVLANELKENRYSATRYALSKASSWQKVNVNTLNWGFKNGDKDGFIKALCSALRPMEDIIAMLLCEGKIEILGCIDVYGSNGYNTAVIPLLEAFGCDSDSILTYEEYKKASDKGKGIQVIVEAVVSLIDRILDKPVYTVTQILPNLLYFINGGGIETCIENLIYPFTVLLKELGMEDMLDMSGMVEIDLEKIISDMLKDNEFGIDISGFDINEYAKMGKAVTVKSKRTVGSEFADITYIEADQTAIMVSLMRFIAGMLKDPEADMMGTLMGSSLGENQMVSGFVDGIAEDIDNMTIDETVEWMYKIFFRERPIVEQEQTEEYLPTIIYKPANRFEGIGIYIFILALALAELIYIKERVRINRFLKRRLVNLKNLKKQITQEV
jgi:hypothetical protein